MVIAMRRKDREVTDFDEIADILRRADTLRLGLNGALYPYVVPLSFGLEAADGKITVYIHGAAEGFKHGLIEKDPRVCVEADIFHRYADGGGRVTAEYESFIGFGRAEIIEGEEAARALDLLLEHCGYAGFEYGREALKYTRVYRVEMAEFGGKRGKAEVTEG